MPYSESTVFDRSSYYFFTMTFWVFDAMFTAYMSFPLERAIIFKERSSGAYRLSAYFMAKTTSEAPARLTLPSIYMLISYWMSGVNNNIRIFLASTLCSLLSVLAGESIGLFLGAAVLDLEKGMVVMTVVSLGLMVVGGFFVRTLPAWMIWLGYLSPFKYSYNSSVQLVFDKPVPCDGSKVLSSCQGGAVGSASVEEVLDFLGVQYSAGFNAALLFVMFVVIRIMAFFALKSKKADERT
jgi:ABC-type multidrug transport system permease subunit